MPDALDRLVTTELGPVSELTVAELRERRNEIQQHEQTLSYLRRLVQGRLDIVLDERHRRDEGGAERDLAHLVEDLPKILSDRNASGGRGALPEVSMPADDVDEFISDVDAVIDADRLGSLSSLSDAELGEVIDGLTALEKRVSGLRRSLHGSIDQLQEEIIRRYKTGEASVDALIP